MKKIIIIMLCVFFMGEICVSASDTIDKNIKPDIIENVPLALSDCYELALKVSENIAGKMAESPSLPSNRSSIHCSAFLSARLRNG